MIRGLMRRRDLWLAGFLGLFLNAADDGGLRALLEKRWEAFPAAFRTVQAGEKAFVLARTAGGTTVGARCVREDGVWRIEKDFATPAGLGQLAAELLEDGTRHREQGRYAEAAERYTLAREAADAAGDRKKAARALNDLGVVDYYRGNYDEAVALARQALAIQEAIQDLDGVAASLTNIGLVATQQGRYDQAIEYHLKALDLRTQAGDRIKAAASRVNIGASLHLRGSYQQALENYEAALAVFEAADDQRKAAVVLRNLGDLLNQQGNYPLALDYLRRGLRVCEALGDRKGAAGALNNLANSHFYLRDYRHTEEYYEKARALSEQLGDRLGVARALLNLGGVAREEKRCAEALDFYGRSLGVQESAGHFDQVTTLRHMALCDQALGKHKEMLDHATRAVELARNGTFRQELWQCLHLSGMAYRELGDRDQARRAFAESIEVVETIRLESLAGERDRQTIMEGMVQPYRLMTTLLLEEGKTAPALSVSEHVKARVLMDLFGRSHAAAEAPPGEGQRDEERRLAGELARWNTSLARETARPHPDAGKLRECDEERQRARRAIERFYLQVSAKRGELPRTPAQSALGADELERLAQDERTALAEFMVTPEKTWLFVYTRSAGLRAYPIDLPEERLEGRVAAFRKQLADRDLGVRQEARALFELLLGSAREQLRGKSRLVIVPDAALWNLPFQALESGPNRYLLEDAAILLAPSLAALREMRNVSEARRNNGSGRLLAMANPSSGPARAPGTEREVKALARLYGRAPSKAVSYVGAAATEARFKTEAGSYDVIHLATHGVFDDSDPMYSHVALAGSDGEDGFLEAWELLRLNFGARLIVFSACETGRGRASAGEGLVGLSWAAFLAGSPTSVVSRWKVDSASTTELMVKFHKKLLENGSSPAEALRGAALDLLRHPSYRHPFYWAGFAVTGAGF